VSYTHDPYYSDALYPYPSRHSGREESVTTTRVVKPVPLAIPPVPEGVHIENARRASDEERNRFVAHLQDMHSRGFMDDDELAARIEAAEAAVVTEMHLKPLIADLHRESVAPSGQSVIIEQIEPRPGEGLIYIYFKEA
jgi:hypothetical protein